MTHSTLKASIIAIMMLPAAINAGAQENCILDKPGLLFKKNERKAQMPVKSRYFFETSPQTGREYLRQQDLFDPKGRIKSSGIFSDDGNKAGDIRYTFDAAGVLQKKELKFIGKNEKEITFLNPQGKPVKIEKRTKGDTLLSTTAFTYDDAGNLKEEKLFIGEKLISANINENVYNKQGKPLQLYSYKTDSLGNKLPGATPFTENEYDDKGMILQSTVYRDKEKRKLLNWVYYKYQLDNDYKVIKQSGYNEEQTEISKVELTYTDSSITETSYAICKCPEKTMVITGARQMVFNAYGELIRERVYDASGKEIQLSSFRYDDFGNKVDSIVENAAEPGKINRNKQILEVYTDQAKIAK